MKGAEQRKYYEVERLRRLGKRRAEGLRARSDRRPVARSGAIFPLLPVRGGPLGPRLRKCRADRDRIAPYLRSL